MLRARWWPLLPFGLALFGALLSSYGGSSLHTAGIVQSLTGSQVGSRAAEEADYLARGLFWFAAAGALFWLAFMPLSWPIAPRTSNVTALCVLLAFAALAAYLAGDNPNRAFAQFLWVVFYVGVPVLTFLAAYPFVRVAIDPPDSLLEDDDENEQDADEGDA